MKLTTNRFALEALEPRMLMAADPVALAMPAEDPLNQCETSGTQDVMAEEAAALNSGIAYDPADQIDDIFDQPTVGPQIEVMAAASDDEQENVGGVEEINADEQSREVYGPQPENVLRDDPAGTPEISNPVPQQMVEG